MDDFFNILKAKAFRLIDPIRRYQVLEHGYTVHTNAEDDGEIWGHVGEHTYAHACTHTHAGVSVVPGAFQKGGNTDVTLYNMA